jgi:hypothetical protein
MLSWPEIGLLLGGFDHSSMMYAARRVKQMITEDALLRIDLLEIADQLLLLRRPRGLSAPELRLLPAI